MVAESRRETFSPPPRVGVSRPTCYRPLRHQPQFGRTAYNLGSHRSAAAAAAEEEQLLEGRRRKSNTQKQLRLGASNTSHIPSRMAGIPVLSGRQLRPAASVNSTHSMLSAVRGMETVFSRIM